MIFIHLNMFHRLIGLRHKNSVKEKTTSNNLNPFESRAPQIMQQKTTTPHRTIEIMNPDVGEIASGHTITI